MTSNNENPAVSAAGSSNQAIKRSDDMAESILDDYDKFLKAKVKMAADHVLTA